MTDHQRNINCPNIKGPEYTAINISYPAFHIELQNYINSTIYAIWKDIEAIMMN